MDYEGGLAIIAIAISIATAIWAVFAHRQLVRHTSLHANMAAIVELYRCIEAAPSILRLHGVSEEDLTASGLTAQEFGYLLASFEAGSVYYRFHETSDEPFKPSSLRYRLLATPATRRAWPLISRFFEADSPFMRKIEATLMLFDSPEDFSPMRISNSQRTDRNTRQHIPANPAASTNQKDSLSGR